MDQPTLRPGRDQGRCDRFVRHGRRAHFVSTRQLSLLAASGTALLAVVGSVPSASARTVDAPSSYAAPSAAAPWANSAPLARPLSQSLLAQPAVIALPAPVVRTLPPRVSAARPTTALRAVGPTYVGRASWYGPGFQGRRTANGERFDTQDLTAAHKFLPFGTRLRVCRAGRCVVVRVNDRGPYVRGRFLDLSRRAAQLIGVTEQGVCTVTATVLAAPESTKGGSWADALG
ncbi:MAG: rare lipoprotein [Frankiaceae bacterium]|nr:rare lipoprotein [Frankiaceae bacterium]